MRYYLLVLLACLVLAVPVAAIQTNPREVGCSGDPYKYGDASIIWVKYLSGFGDITFIDGKAKMPIGDAYLYGTPGRQYSVAPGRHTLEIFSQGYNNYTANVQVCDKEVSYVNYNKTALVRTTATTTVPITTSMVILFMTTPAVATQVTSTTTASIAVIPAVTTNPPTSVPQAETTAPPDTLGSLSVTTTPAGAFIFIDGVQRGVSPSIIPGLSTGTHSLLLKLDGYQDLSTPVTIAAGKTQDYSSGMVKNVAAVTTPAATENPAATPKKVTGFEFILALVATGTIFVLRIVSQG